MTKKEKEELAELVAEKVMQKIRVGALREMAWSVFGALGLEGLEEVVNLGQENRKEKGHTDYMDLTSFYEQKLRGRAITNLQEILKKLGEVIVEPKRKLIKREYEKS